MTELKILTAVTPAVLQKTVKRIGAPNALRQVLRELETALSPYREMYAQFQLVAEYSGMASIRQMHAYASNPTNLAIVVASSVLDEAEKFEKLYKETVEKNASTFQYLRTLNPFALYPLSASNFLDLYFVAVESAKGSSNLAAAFQMSQHPNTASKEVLKRWVGKTIVGAGVSDNRKRQLSAMGIDPEEPLKKIRRIERRDDDE